ncbi:hypothetical protein, partial [Enterobacter sp. SECR19-1250]|uniref:hypothetical protein n=1 Tax=Enterobacter sp. SECR19-1250 TaxID=2749084 RepID=UPI001C49DF0B
TCRQNRCCKNGSDHRFRFTRLSGLIICSQATRPSKNARLQKIAKQSRAKRAGVKLPALGIIFFFT